MGQVGYQIALFVLLAILPIVLACSSAYIYMAGFYKVKHNRVGTYKRVSSSTLTLNDWVTDRKQERNSLATTHRQSRISEIALTVPRAFRQSTLIEPATVETGDKRRTVLIATMEYDIEDWKIKVKIGGLGVIAQLMGKELGHINLIWVIPCVGNLTYPVDTPVEAMKVVILGVEYSISVQHHQVGNITYVLLDAPIFRQQTQTEPYPARMDDLTSAIYYSAWNQCIAQTITRFPIDLYHINDYHGCIAPLYLLPRSTAVCLSLHNAEFQGLWPMRTPLECKEVSRVFNLGSDVIQTFVQFGEVFNMLYAGASYLRYYQSGFGAVGVSAKYGQRVHLRYPIFWGLKKIGQLPNPDPSDTAEWNGEHARETNTVIDQKFEAERPLLRVAAQKWAGLEEDPDADLFVFVGRWSVQKGIDLIADIFPTVLKEHSKAQLICVGPVIDIYGKFAALKLEKLAKRYPKRVCSRPVFTALPSYIFSGAEFALIPSRDEPFGLVAVEFGRKGALGVGSRVGGLGTMPGWWYTIEAMSTQHLLNQFRKAIEDSLTSSKSSRAMMRALAAKQRFPVAQWVELLDVLQTSAMRAHSKGSHKRGSMLRPPAQNLPGTVDSRPTTPPDVISSTGVDLRTVNERLSQIGQDGLFDLGLPRYHVSQQSLQSCSPGPTPLDIGLVVGDKKDYLLQQVDPFFTDSKGHYYAEFERRLEKSDDMSEMAVCIEEYVKRSEKAWYQLRHAAKLGKEMRVSVAETPPLRSIPGVYQGAPRTPKRQSLLPSRLPPVSMIGTESPEARLETNLDTEEFLLGENYRAPRYLRNWMQLRIYDWPVYSLFLALGQIMAANSYQLSLLTGQVGQEAQRLYVLCSIYFVSSGLLWILTRRVRSVTVLTIPFIIYGLAFLFIGVSPFGTTTASRGWLQNIGTGLYTTASASGSLYFSLNFGDEGGSTTRVWISRAAIIQGLQQVYISVLWFWGANLSRETAASLSSGLTKDSSFSTSWKLTIICVVLVIFLWIVAAVVAHGLPKYYHQIPGQNRSFYRSILRRRIILWFFVAVTIQNFFLSAQYGRSWIFLWNSQHLSYWHIAGLVVLFSIIVWAFILWGVALLSRSHSWLLPILAVGLGAPRWAQTWWGVSGMGAWLPWTDGYIASAIVSRSLWLWLGTLDAVQNVGIGMILLSTTTRMHAGFALLVAQGIGSLVTALARFCAPNAIGPGPVFPNIVATREGLLNAWFWIGLSTNVIACFGFFIFYRKEQLNKP